MQTIPVFSTCPNGDSHTVLWDDQVIGKIDFNITTLKWEYSRYSQYPEVTTGNTPEECIEAARIDCANVKAQPLQVTVTEIGTDNKPAYIHRHTSWRTHGAHSEVTVTVQAGSEVYQVLVGARFARSLCKGSRVELHHDPINGLFLKWPAKPVRRCAIATA